MKVLIAVLSAILLVNSVAFGANPPAGPTSTQRNLERSVKTALAVEEVQLTKAQKTELLQAVLPLLNRSQVSGKPAGPFRMQILSQTTIPSMVALDKLIDETIPATTQAFADKFETTIRVNAWPIAEGFKGDVQGLGNVTGPQRQKMREAAAELVKRLQ